MLAVKKDVGTAEQLALAVRMLAALAASRRAQGPPTPIRNLMMSPMDIDWHKVLQQLSNTPLRRDQSSSRGKWSEQAFRIREQWREAGNEWCNDQPWTAPARGASPALRGLSGCARQREVIDLAFLCACAEEGLNPRARAHRHKVASGLFVNVSQNPCRRAWGRVLGTFCASSIVYSFEHDRTLIAEEMLRVLGWGAVDAAGLSQAALRDLAGESLAKPCIAAAAVAMLATVHLPGLWAQR